MIKFLPRTLTSQTIWVLLIGLSVSHFFSMMIYSGDRVETLSMMGGRNMAQRIASISHLVVETPDEWRERIVSALNESSFRVTMTPENTLVTQPSEGGNLIDLREFLRIQCICVKWARYMASHHINLSGYLFNSAMENG
jgi:hypothetical protein